MKKNLAGVFIYILLVSCGDFLEPKSTSEFVPKDATSLNEIILGDAYPRPDDRIAINTFLGLFPLLVLMVIFGSPVRGWSIL